MKRSVVLWVVVGSVLILSGPGWAGDPSKGKRDPFYPLLTGKGERLYPVGFDEEILTGASRLRLQGVMVDPDAESYAIINGQVVREKEEIEGALVLRIGPGFVTVLVEGQEHQLPLSQDAAPEKPAPQTVKKENAL